MGMPTSEAQRTRDADGADSTVWFVRLVRLLVFAVYLFVLVKLVLLTLGFFLRLFGASTDAEFTRWVYRNVDNTMDPFRGMFPSRTVSDHSMIDTSLLFAMIVYAIVAIALHLVITWLAHQVVALKGRRWPSP